MRSPHPLRYQLRGRTGGGSRGLAAGGRRGTFRELIRPGERGGNPAGDEVRGSGGGLAVGTASGSEDLILAAPARVTVELPPELRQRSPYTILGTLTFVLDRGRRRSTSSTTAAPPPGASTRGAGARAGSSGSPSSWAWSRRWRRSTGSGRRSGGATGPSTRSRSSWATSWSGPGRGCTPSTPRTGRSSRSFGMTRAGTCCTRRRRSSARSIRELAGRFGLAVPEGPGPAA